MAYRITFARKIARHEKRTINWRCFVCIMMIHIRCCVWAFILLCYGAMRVCFSIYRLQNRILYLTVCFFLQSLQFKLSNIVKMRVGVCFCCFFLKMLNEFRLNVSTYMRLPVKYLIKQKNFKVNSQLTE